ncbi:hypothetical protein AGLY_009832 [Aphis glycines]|uniref:Uncharacterized protein n=1 Tax=Aphis glycines TaxID=307491 RepID=A0A6G0TH18_APHGL|nr:hypothetical protein AGLY_009832 [Aphis glycines]
MTIYYLNYGRFDSKNLSWWVFFEVLMIFGIPLMYLIIKFCSPFSLRFCNVFLRFAISFRCLVVLSEEKIFCTRKIEKTSDCSVRRIFMGRGLSWIVDFVLPRRENLKSPIFSFKSSLSFSFSGRLNNITLFDLTCLSINSSMTSCSNEECWVWVSLFSMHNIHSSIFEIFNLRSRFSSIRIEKFLNKSSSLFSIRLNFSFCEFKDEIIFPFDVLSSVTVFMRSLSFFSILFRGTNFYFFDKARYMYQTLPTNYLIGMFIVAFQIRLIYRLSVGDLAGDRGAPSIVGLWACAQSAQWERSACKPVSHGRVEKPNSKE